MKCELCGLVGHDDGAHPFPKDSDLYDAFYDATDEELGEMVSRATWPDGRPINPSS